MQSPIEKIIIKRIPICAPKILVATLLLLLICLHCVVASDKPNFIVILTDDQSWVGSSVQIKPNDTRTRSDFYLTPHMERMARMGMRFTQGYSPAASCCPTRRALQTGQFPARHEYNADRGGWTDTYRKQLNITRMLKAANDRYVTAHFGKWDHRYDEISPAQQGYDFSDGYTSNGTGGSKGSGGPAAMPDPKRIDTITDKALHFIVRNHHRKKPFYLQLSHYAVHLDVFYNQQTLEAFRKRSPGRKHTMPEFAAMTADMDSGIGRILDKLEELEMLKNTWLFFLSDNGGRNSIPKAQAAKEHLNAPLRDGKHSFYEGGIRVPFIVLGPGVKPGSVSNIPVSGVDLLPTLAELSGYVKPLPENIDGGSIRELLVGDGLKTVKRKEPFLIFHQGVDRKVISAIRLGNYKLVKTWREDRLELFDIERDIGESIDLSKKMKSKTDELHGLLLKYLKEVNADTGPRRQKGKQR